MAPQGALHCMSGSRAECGEEFAWHVQMDHPSACVGSRELLQREVRQLRALQEGDAITSQTSALRATGNGVELCKAPRPAHRRELSAHSEVWGLMRAEARNHCETVNGGGIWVGLGWVG
jgi:hypothetical protein